MLNEVTTTAKYQLMCLNYSLDITKTGSLHNVYPRF